MYGSQLEVVRNKTFENRKKYIFNNFIINLEKHPLRIHITSLGDNDRI